MSEAALQRDAALKSALPDSARLQRITHWILRVGVCMCFVGHGAFGIMGKKVWLAYTDVVGIPHDIAWQLQPIIGACDIAMGILTLCYLLRGLLAWGAFWCVWTALLRPLAGQGFSEFFERGGNYGVVLGFLILAGWRGTFRGLFMEPAWPNLNPSRAKALHWVLRVCTALLLLGHGGFGVFGWHAKEWFGYFGVLGVSQSAAASISLVTNLGWFEMALGVAVLVFPNNLLLAFVVAWKIGTELLRPAAGEPFWEWVERGGSYTVPLALIFVNIWLARFATRGGPRPRPKSSLTRGGGTSSRGSCGHRLNELRPLVPWR